jgi:hypothetical protein
MTPRKALRRVKIIVWTEGGSGNPAANVPYIWPSGATGVSYRTAWLNGLAYWQEVTDTVILKIDTPDTYYNSAFNDVTNGFCRGQHVPGRPKIRKIIPGLKVSTYLGAAAAGTIYSAANVVSMSGGVTKLTVSAGVNECLLDWESALYNTATGFNWWTEATYDNAQFDTALIAGGIRDKADCIHYPSRIDETNGVAILNTIRARLNPRYIMFWPNSLGDFTDTRTINERSLRDLSGKYVLPNLSVYKSDQDHYSLEFNLFEYALKPALLRSADTPYVTFYVPMSNFEFVGQRVLEFYDNLL